MRKKMLLSVVCAVAGVFVLIAGWVSNKKTAAAGIALLIIGIGIWRKVARLYEMKPSGQRRHGP